MLLEQAVLTKKLESNVLEAPPVLIGVSQVIRRICELADKVAASDCCVLIEGESGTGKELIARRLHASSPRNSGPFIPVNCAAISETLFESQFFGHVKGAFTGAEQTMLGFVRSAENGTLLMDEVGETPLHLQAKLLRTLQSGEVTPVGSSSPRWANTRFIAATNCDLRSEVRSGRLREDLFYRLNVVSICLPPLRDRAEDIGPLLDHFLKDYAQRASCTVAHVDVETRRKLQYYPWPGNVRELISWVERLYATGEQAGALAEALLAESIEFIEPTAESPLGPMSLEQAERNALQDALAATDGKVQEAADLLDIHRSTLFRKLRAHGLT